MFRPNPVKKAYPIALMRQNDFKVMEAESKKPLAMDASRCRPAKDDAIVTYGGTSAKGPYLKKSSKSDRHKIFFVAQHRFNEYFAIEVLLRLGIRTPKARIIGNQYVATKGIEGYIPMIGVRHDLTIAYSKDKLTSIRQQYKIDTEKQIIIDSQKREYKISGNAFAANIAAILIQDADFQCDGCNFGLTRVGNRFYAAAIDKDKVSFNGRDYREGYTDKLFQSQTHEQSFYIIYQVFQALSKNADGICDFDKIFLNTRVMATPKLAEISKEACDNLKLTAQSLLNHYHKKYGEKFLVEFADREQIRIKIAAQLIKAMNLDASWEALIVEDLRGPYYQNLFHDKNKRMISEHDLVNKKLINKINDDIQKEMGQSFQPTDPIKESKLSENESVIGKRKFDGKDNENSPKRLRN